MDVEVEEVAEKVKTILDQLLRQEEKLSAEQGKLLERFAAHTQGQFT